jgi:hypothetical protein
MSNFAGKDGFSWFYGVVEDRNDPLQIGRVKVRVLGFHNEKKEVMPTDALPWATPIQPVTAPNISGVGFSPHGLIEGMWVVGFWADVNNYQIPLILGAISGLNKEPDSTKDREEMFGNVFRDFRSEGMLRRHPKNKIAFRQYPDGQETAGDAHGAQIFNEPLAEKHPRELYKDGACSFSEGTPDTNVVAVNDPGRIDKTLIKIKKDKRPEGLREELVPVANIENKRFLTGIINMMLVNRGTNKALGWPPAVSPIGIWLRSSSFSSKKKDYASVKEGPTNINKQKIYMPQVNLDEVANIVTAKTIDGFQKLLNIDRLNSLFEFKKADDLLNILSTNPSSSGAGTGITNVTSGINNVSAAASNVPNAISESTNRSVNTFRDGVTRLV